MSAGSAQYLIPDLEFAARLEYFIVPSAMNNGVLDTTHIDVLTLDSMDIENGGIFNLSGIQYFAGLNYLKCSDNNISDISQVPNTVRELNCFVNDLVGILSFPDSLRSLNCAGNDIDSISQLPIFLEYFYCYNNDLQFLPPLPSSLLDLHCSTNPIVEFPPLPSGLEYLRCNNIQLDSISSLPTELRWLDCEFDNLPTLPYNLRYLENTSGLIDSIPAFPDFLEYVHLNSESITELPELPIGLNYLMCYGCGLESLPDLPNTIETLVIPGNSLVNLPELPTSLKQLFAAQNIWLDSLPNLPDSLELLDISSCQIDCLPFLPNSLEDLLCWQTNITCLPNFPIGQDIDDYGLSFDPILCDPGSPCFPDEAITGKIYFDDNSNGILDPGEPSLLTAAATAQPGNHMIGPSSDGSYVLALDTGTFVLTGAPVLYHELTVDPDTITLLSMQVDSLNHIGYHSIPNIYDLFSDITVTQPARTGFDNRVWIDVHNIGTEPTSATVEFTFDTDQSWVNSQVSPDAINGNTATWSTTIALGETWSTYVDLNTDVLIPIGTPIEHTLSATPALPDTTPSNNVHVHTEVVVNSWDPNDKLAIPEAMTESQILSGDRIQYTIRFQNTGTATAYRVVILDTLSADLQWNSFDFVSSSHDCSWTLNEGVLHFEFDPISLPDSASHPTFSQGFVKFSIKPSSTLQIGDEVENIAYIYFDFNEAVITPPSIFWVYDPLSLSEVDANEEVHIYPNPTEGQISIWRSNSHPIAYSIFDIMGRGIQSGMLTDERTSIDISNNLSGIYIVRFEFQEGPLTRKIILQR